MEKELEYLEYTLEKYSEVISDSKLKLSNLKELYKGDLEGMIEEKFRLEKEIESINRASLSPYFGRIDFRSENNNEKCYLGKLGVSDYDNNIITVDWRAPIASLYYDSNKGKCSYQAPDGIIEGELLLKRQYTIENSKLIDYYDVDSVSNDELLKPYLNSSADNRLKNIVSTIQSEQNKIIRENMGKDLVIQGVAGSGKTTVALHRIAYLVYNNRDIYKPSNYMVIGPNKFFVNYISGILPDLDVNGVLEYTLEEVFENYLDEKYIIDNSLDKLIDNNISRYKTSMDMKLYIDNYFNNMVILPNEDFIINGVKILSKNHINKIYNELDKNTFKSIKSRIDKTIILVNKYLEDNKSIIITKLINEGVNKETIDIVKNELLKYLRKYFTILNKKVSNIYKEILVSLNYDTDKLNKNIVEIEDIPSMLYISYLLTGSHIYDNIKHIVIDEAQDYGLFAFYVLKKIFKNSTFSIYGDLAQSIYGYRSISSWDELNSIFNNLEILRLNKSYRTTIEIMNEANKINRLLGLDEAEAVIRHGDEVEYTNKDICDILDINQQYGSVAIISKDGESANMIYNFIKDKYEVSLITPSNLSYNSKITVLPSYLSKGLEFDVVIVIDKDKYDVNNVLDMKLLYVSLTRALHKLYIKE